MATSKKTDTNKKIFRVKKVQGQPTGKKKTASAKTITTISSKTIIKVEDDRTGLSIETLKRAIMDNLFYILARFPEVATRHDYYLALAYTVRDRLLHHWLHTAHTYHDKASRTICYLSAEFLLGPHLGNNLINLGIYDKVRETVELLDLDLEKLIDQEEEPGLGNGGLGRLAACYLDSMATLKIPAIGYGIRYEFGIFDQEIHDGWQVEVTDKWLRLGNPWEIPRPEICFDVEFGGHTESYTDKNGKYRVRWIPSHMVKGIAFDTPIVGYHVNNANLLRLWKAEACESFNFQAFNTGDYYGAVHEKMNSENITKVLYPNDEKISGKTLRLEQQYFFVSCSLRDMIRIHLQSATSLERFCDKYTIQLNDTHPAIAVPELMRLLMDEYDMEWDPAWSITSKTFAYTNHTLLPEALEKWPVALFGQLLPRHLEIIYEINARFLEDVSRQYPGDKDLLQRLSLIDENGERYIRMAHLACVGSYAINGVAHLHTQLLKQDVLKDFHMLWPQKIRNKTNGVTPRRWLVLSNPRLTRLISDKIGDSWVANLSELSRLEPFAQKTDFQKAWRKAKHEIKTHFARFILKKTGIVVDPNSMFDIQVKRIHQYKRQHLNALHIITLYNRIKQNPDLDIVPRTFIFGGKAAPGYFFAKLIIKLINSIGKTINQDPDVAGRIKVVFLPDFNVKLAHRIYPAADLSEQISTAGKEASGTGNMKFALNGALTIGTMDGANIEIREHVKPENFFLFGLDAKQVTDLKHSGYHPDDYYHNDMELKAAIDAIGQDVFCRDTPGLFKPLVETLLQHDPYMLLADYRSYVDCQHKVDLVYQDMAQWTYMSIMNTARMGYFSSDRSIQEYCDDIWHIDPVEVDLSLDFTTHHRKFA